MFQTPKYDDIRDLVQEQFDVWLEQARTNPDLRTVDVWLERVNQLDADIGIKGLRENYLRHIDAITDTTKQRSGYALLALALHARKTVGGHWGWCFEAACEVRNLNPDTISDWFNAQAQHVPEVVLEPATSAPQQHAEALF